jgi:hypothetical protein
LGEDGVKCALIMANTGSAMIGCSRVKSSEEAASSIDHADRNGSPQCLSKSEACDGHAVSEYDAI